MIFYFDKRIFGTQHALIRHNDKIEHLRLTLNDLVGVLSRLFNEVGALGWPLLALLLEHLL